MSLIRHGSHKRHRRNVDNYMSGGNGGGGGEDATAGQAAANKPTAGLDEEQVSPIKDVWTRFPNTQNCRLHYFHTQFLNNTAATSEPPVQPFDDPSVTMATSLASTTGGAWNTPGNRTLITPINGIDLLTPRLFQFRMTTPYNVIKRMDDNTSFSSQPVWLELFDSKYRYYHVPDLS